jgi:hypothetical protein
VFTFEDYFLGATGEKVCNPRQSITSHSRVVEFQKTSVWNFIEGLIPSDWKQARVAPVFKKEIEVNQQTTGPSQ